MSPEQFAKPGQLHLVPASSGLTIVQGYMCHASFEVLVHMAGFLDSFTLSQLALVSRLMREVCSSLLHDRGMVSLKWEKKVYSHGGWC